MTGKCSLLLLVACWLLDGHADLPTWTYSGRNLTSVPVVGILDLSENNITHIAEGNLEPYRQVVDLDLSDNTIDTIDTGAFRQLRELKYIDLSGNRLTFVHPCLFYYNNKLDRLDLKNNPLRPLQGGAPLLVSGSLHVLELTLPDLAVDDLADLPRLIHLHVGYGGPIRPSIRGIASSYALQVIQPRRRYSCDLKVTWQSNDSRTAECWQRTASVTGDPPRELCAAQTTAPPPENRTRAEQTAQTTTPPPPRCAEPTTLEPTVPPSECATCIGAVWFWVVLVWATVMTVLVLIGLIIYFWKVKSRPTQSTNDLPELDPLQT